MSSARMRSPLGRALGLGSARDGVDAWWRERVSAVALVPLTAWLTVSILMRADKGYAAVVAWLKLPITTTLMTLLLIALFYHTALGLQVVIEDYVHSRIKIPVLVGMHLGCVALGVAGLVAVLKIALA
ncbi:MAG: succinate dehydrogenase, hydrophobic membrane anchor protein [Bradyrhizobium sp.]|uniref:succinate dehydrogenase, hydrophobic membrane anchor protein n=1 Tax=Bradyrhizobium sp. TaxID=376 RepID=UPI001C284058|nr:succinate dehydrogenase, hydrophobic membrane anchor protein [Bradyrhizobium sp.]MBU6464796.1 succinate dehydrogenase, hydrophobic membrane anchor protein [Pseudomonadota bacterium]MDE2069537.1 succinate dehydrogenase, hydrophobic membrane anchor protein [Bradyrhizobium sp.]MDE2473176.1 succinate dehydrogenase, hydrophobic membrane anchor protein [Bradyrhizobium sp.]